METDLLSKLFDVIKAINSELNLSRQLEIIMDSLIDISKAERGFLLLPQNGELRVMVARNIAKEEIDDANKKISRTILNRVAESPKPLILSDASKVLNSESVQSQKLRSVCVLPLKIRNTLIGIAYLDSSRRDIFSDEQVDILKTFASQISVAINNARIFEAKDEKLEDVIDELAKERSDFSHRYSRNNIIGKSLPMQKVFKLIDKVTNVNFPVLIYGESGTGKELVAKAIHYNGERKDKPFVAINCGSIPETLIESELFGYKRGAFSGADKDKSGLFEIANNGTLFLDEISNISSACQEALLRVLQENEILPIGGKEPVKIDVRIISASNIELAQLVEEGLFRNDLYYRLNVINISMPPLRERKEDIPLLVEHFLDKIAKETKQARREITKNALWLLTEYNWQGNVRELENVIKQVITFSESDVLNERDFKSVLKREKHMEILSADDYIKESLKKCIASKMSYREIAQRLGITEKALWEKRKQWGI